MKRLYIQQSEDSKTLIKKLVGVITFVIGPDSMDLKMRSTCASAVLQCRGERQVPAMWQCTTVQDIYGTNS
jgi:hypothetical protein